MTATVGSVRIAGGLFPADLLGRIAAEDSKLPLVGPATYGLQASESVRRQAARSWDYLLAVWNEFQERLENTPESARTELTRQRWSLILLRELGFHSTVIAGGLDIDGVSYPISHVDDELPVHLLGWQTDLDHRTPGRTARAPHSMVQELLNRSEKHLWAVLSNGSSLRLLRDSRTLTGTAYVEFDLQAMFDGLLYPDFLLLYRMCHRSRFETLDAGCPLEAWVEAGEEAGSRALERLRIGVQEAVQVLGTGFLTHPLNPQLKHRINGSGELRVEDFNRALLRVVYRLLFWFVAEDRAALLDPAAAPLAEKRYRTYFSSDRLRRLAWKLRGDRHHDLWEAARQVFGGLGNEHGLPELGLPGIGGLFENGPLDEPLDGARLSNQALLNAVRALSLTVDPDSGRRRPVDFGNLGSEELGSVYEWLLDAFPRYDPDEVRYVLERLQGNERKETGSYYTPSSLVECLLDSTLEPLLDEAAADDDPETALLALTVCDPACGSGHFLVAAARRIAKRLAAVRSDDPEPSDGAVQSALRQVVGRCIYGVDLNPMAAELAKVSLWMEAMEAGKPLTFLDSNIRVGNSLLGVTPTLLRAGIPDVAFKAIGGDDKKAATTLRKLNKEERVGQGDLFSVSEIEVSNRRDAAEVTQIVHSLPQSLEDVHIQAQRVQDLMLSPDHQHQKLLADTWCAAFVQPKQPEKIHTAITDAVLKRLAADPDALSGEQLDLVIKLARDYRFFHWHIEFPHIFRVNGHADADPATGWSGGFSCVIGNPPWERVKLQEKEFFASRRAEIASAINAAERKRQIEALKTSPAPTDRKLHAEFQAELRKADGWSHLLRAPGRYPLTGTGDINTYAVFAETGRTVIGPMGRAGMVLPTGIATDLTTSRFFSDLVRRSALASFLEFENEAYLLSRAVDHRVRFSLLSVAGSAVTIQHASFSFGVRYMRDLEERTFAIPPEEILLVNPNTGTTPVFRSRRDAEITLDIYRRVPVLWREHPEENPWGLSFMAMLHMANDSGLFCTKEQLEADGWQLDGNVFVKDGRRMLPLYEAKMVHHFDHRLGTYEGQTEAQANMGTLPRLTLDQKDDPAFAIMSRYWVSEEDIPTGRRDKKGEEIFEPGVATRLGNRHWNKPWLLGWRKIARSSDIRTLICALFPISGYGDSGNLVLSSCDAVAPLTANLSSFVLDYVLRMKLAGTNINYFQVMQLPVLPPERYEEKAPWATAERLDSWVTARVLELSYTAYDMEGFARDHGDSGPPFRWDEERRELLRAELDAAYFHLYGVERDDVDYIMDSFRAFRNNDPERFARTKALILRIYDGMAEAIRTGQPYQTILDPSPGHGPRHPARRA